MSSTKTDSDSSVIFVGKQHIVQLHPDQEQRINFVHETPTRPATTTTTTTSTHETGEITTIPETQHTGTQLPQKIVILVNKFLNSKNIQVIRLIAHPPRKTRHPPQKTGNIRKNCASVFSVGVWYVCT